ncbi:DnaB-like helicase N-terminal domain-containing protein [Nocardioides sp. Arc9.136]|uniref:DnaB-like helicase N-terminal domain-containing protein n=1 Tax=Nocardioides sp. Arc9.136 TaxID=2996826 RepID=UPI002666373E|nr:DnaB-like helicase N-terminal domain-containing protein [Nocardioides sp. Arc9.136]WKN47128.1 hypothetical protein OSR43_13880 [Nocardioides sp. Arc9.136]
MTYDGPPSRHLHPVDDQAPFDPDYDRPNIGRRPPQDQAAEQAILAALLATPDPDGTHPGDRLRQIIDAADFYWPVHATIWETWHDLHAAQGVPPDAVTLNAAILKTRDQAAIRAVADLVTTTANPALAEHYATIVRDLARLRVVSDLATGLNQIVTNADATQVDAYLGEALQRLDETAMRFGPTTHTTSTGLADLTWVLGGQPPAAVPPVWCRRADGTALFYAGRHNGVFGDPEGGKTWLAQVAGVEALHAGQTFAMIDVDHNGQDHTAARLLLLGARPDQIADPDRFRYYEPEDSDQLRAAVTEITRLAPAVVVIDSLGEVLPMLGVKSVDNDEITAALRTIVMPPAKAGSCVISVDHLPKSAEARTTGYAIGGTAKKRAVDGAYLRVEARQQPTPGGIGRITLRIEKDRTGELRKSSGGGYAGTFTLDSTQPHVTTWSIGRDEIPKNDDGTFRKTVLMERISKYIEDHDQCTQTEIVDAVGSKKEWVRDAINVLVSEGYVARIDGARRAKLHHSIAPYRQTEDDHVQA